MQRNNVYDIAKCWAIISVLVYHVVRTFVHWEVVSSFIDTYFLSLFFFISGLLTKDVKITRGWCKKQVLHLLVPFVSCWSLYRLFLTCFDVPFILRGALDDEKGGYWFIFVLFIFNVSIWALKSVIDKVKSIVAKYIILLLPFILAAVLCMLLPYDVAGYFSLMSIRRYWLFFAYGYTITNVWKCGAILENNRWGFLALVGYALLASYFVCSIVDVTSNFDFAVWFATNLLGVHAWLFLFSKLQKLLSIKPILNVGYNTLGIYVFHYYPLFILTNLLGETV